MLQQIIVQKMVLEQMLLEQILINVGQVNVYRQNVDSNKCRSNKCFSDKSCDTFFDILFILRIQCEISLKSAIGSTYHVFTQKASVTISSTFWGQRSKTFLSVI